MSTHYYSFEVLGLFLDEQTARKLALKIAEKENSHYDDECEPYEVAEFLGGEYMSEVTDGYKYPICDSGIDYGRGEFIDNYIVLECDKWPMLFKACYSSIDEIVEEFTKKTYGYLSEEYIRSNLCRIVGVGWG